MAIKLYSNDFVKFSFKSSIKDLVIPHPGQFTSNKKLKMQGIVISTPCIFKITDTIK